MNERKLLIDTDTRHTTSSALQHSESFTSLTPFVGKIKIEHFSFLRWLVNFDSHCIYTLLSELSNHLSKKNLFLLQLRNESHCKISNITLAEAYHPECGCVVSDLSLVLFKF